MENIIDLLSPKLIEVLNAIGLPVLTLAIIVMYRTLVKRTSFLETSITDMKNIYDAVIETAQKRSTELEALISNQTRFNELYLKMVQDSSEHAEKVNEWRKSEVILLEERMERLANDLNKANQMIKQLKEENGKLQNEIGSLKSEIAELRKVDMGPSESMARIK